MRADKFLAETFGSRTKAAQILKRGLVLRGEKPLSPDDEIFSGDELFFLPPEQSFVSNGGYKLERALIAFREDVKGGAFADLGASTGGFTDCLLQHGAEKVYCVDVGESQLDPRLASDPRVCVMDKTNARYLKREDFPEPVEIVSDLSFISLRLVLPAISELLRDGGRAFVLFKPQFECGGKGLPKSGILPRERHLPLLDGFYDFAQTLSLSPENIVNAPVRERKNLEYIVLLRKNGTPLPKSEFLLRAASPYEEKN